MARFGEVSRVVGGAGRVTARLLVLGVATVAAASVAGWYVLGRDNTEAPPSVETAQAARGTLATTVTLPGTASSTSSVSLTFPVAGKVAEVNVVIGQAVKAGDPLARVDDTDLRQTLQTSQNNLDLARLKLAQLQASAKPEDAQAARQAVVSADAAVQNAQITLERLKRPPSAADISAADAVVLQAQATLETAQRSVDTTFGSLRSAQNTYCGFLGGILPAVPCHSGSFPLVPDVIVQLQSILGPPYSLPAAHANATTGILSANAAYVNALLSVTTSKSAVEQAKSKRAKLDEGPDNLDIYAAQLTLNNAQESYKSAVAREVALQRGPDPLDVQAQQLAVRTQEIAVATAQQKVTDTVLRAPFAGTVGAVPLIVGQQVGTATAAVTLTDTGTIQVKMTLSESDLPQVRAGQLGVATFDALAGQPFVVRVVGVSPVPTVTQGVVTYAAQASILRGPELLEIQADLQKLAAALSSGSARPGAIQIPGLLGGGAPATETPGADISATAAASATAASTAATKGAGLPGGGQRPQGDGPGGPGAGGAGAGGQRFPGVGAGAGASGAQRLPTEGMSGSVILVQSVSENVLLVPSGAVRRENRQSVVLVPDGNGGTQSKPVVTGGTDGTRTVITSGLDEGATVITSAVRGTATVTGTARTGQTNQPIPGGPVGPPPGGPGGGNVIR